MTKILAALLCAAAAPSLLPAAAAQGPSTAPVAASSDVQSDWTVKPEWVRAHVNFLAGPALEGRGSATRDEAIAAAYVAARFEALGLKPAPGASGFVQSIDIIRPRLEGAPVITVGGKAFADGRLLIGGAPQVGGNGTLYIGDTLDALPKGEVLLIASDKISPSAAMRAARAKGAKLVILRGHAGLDKLWEQIGGAPRISSYLAGDKPNVSLSVVVLPPKTFDRAAKRAAKGVSLTLPGLKLEQTQTTNAIGYLPGSDPSAGNILLAAHVDHLGKNANGVVMHGANDNASGETAVLELAHALSSGKQMRRGVIFAAFGAEEMGGFGARAFVNNPPVPLDQIVANLAIEMIGAQDPKLPAGSLMMTGYERSTLGASLAQRGALISPDPYTEENFFARSDNYALALRGVVAHTVSGWAVTPNYHSPDDTIDALDIPFMTRAIQSLVGPVRWLGDSDYRPSWNPGGKPGE